MKNYIKYILCCMIFLPSALIPIAFSQTFTIEEIDLEFGLTASFEGPRPSNWRQMVSASEVVVRGKFGGLMANGSFFGWDDEGNLVEPSADSNPVIGKGAIPVSDYEILVEEVFKADIDAVGKISIGDILTFRTLDGDPESKGSKGRFDPSIERIFFLRQNPGKQTYSILGHRFILTNVDGEYFWMTAKPDKTEEDIRNGDVFSYRSLEFENTRNYTEIEHLIKDEVRRQLSNID